jgi:hypothetical protein
VRKKHLWIDADLPIYTYPVRFPIGAFNGLRFETDPYKQSAYFPERVLRSGEKEDFA